MAGRIWVTEPDAIRDIPVGETGAESLPPRTIIAALRERVDLSGDKIALNVERDATVEEWTWRQYYDDITVAAKALIALGVREATGVAIIGFNSPEWFVAELAAIMAGAIPAGIYTTNNPDSCAYIVEHCQASILFVENNAQLQKFLSIRDKMPALRHIVQWRDFAGGLPEGVMSWVDFMAQGASVPQEAVEARIAALHPGKCAVLIYTSGTTGPPKAVMMSHDNLVWAGSQGSGILFDRGAANVVVSFLPMSHIAAQMLDVIIPMLIGATVYFARPDALKGSLGKTLKDVRPTMFLAVPRVWEKIVESMRRQMGQTTGLKKTIADWAREKGLEGGYAAQRGEGKPWGWFFADNLVFSKVKEAIGLDRCRYLGAGAAPTTMETHEFMLSLDMPLLEVYGMSETAGLLTASLPLVYQTGAVGKEVPGTRVKINNPNETGEGEVCTRGRHVMLGYMHSPDQTAAIFDDEGFLHSGDLGRVDRAGFLHITGRLKELIITAGGENIAPVPIEDAIKVAMPFVSNAMIVGDRRKFLSVLLTLKVELDATGAGTDNLTSVATESLGVFGLGDLHTASEAIAHAGMARVLAAGMDAVNQNAVSSACRVQKWLVVPGDFSIAGGELTPTMKLKRKSVCEKYSTEIEAFYADAE